MEQQTRLTTKLEVLLAVAMSGYYQTTHVIFMPPGTHYKEMLDRLRETKDVEPISPSFYKVTKKGWLYLKKQNLERFKKADTQIDMFVDSFIDKL